MDVFPLILCSTHINMLLTAVQLNITKDLTFAAFFSAPTGWKGFLSDGQGALQEGAHLQ